MVGTDQPWMDLSLSGLVTAIVPLRLMTLGAPPYWSDVQTLTPPDSIFVRLVGCQWSHFHEVAHNLMVRRRNVWNQGLVNLSFDDNKTKFRINDYISSVIRQDDFQSGNHKDKSSQWEIMKKKTTSKRSVFQDPSFIRSLCKVIGALWFSYITFFTYAPKSSKSYFVLNILKLDDFMFSTKILCKMFLNLFKRF